MKLIGSALWLIALCVVLLTAREVFGVGSGRYQLSAQGNGRDVWVLDTLTGWVQICIAAQDPTGEMFPQCKTPMLINQ